MFSRELLLSIVYLPRCFLEFAFLVQLRELIDLILHDLLQRMGGGDTAYNLLGGKLRHLLHKGALYALSDNAFNISAAVSLGLGHQLADVDVPYIRFAAFGQMNLEYLFTLLRVWQRHIKYLIKAPFTHQLRGKVRNVIGCGDYEGRTGLFLHPGQERAEQSGRDLRTAAADPGKCLLQLVHPEDAGGHGFG